MGAVFRLPFLYVEDLTAGIEELKKNGLRIYAAHLEGKNPYDREDYRSGCAFLIGNEGNGLTPEAVQACAKRVTIPMRGRAESFNASTAAAIVLWEMMRGAGEGA